MPAPTPSPSSGPVTHTGGVLVSLRQFAGLDPASTLVVARWLFLRAVGLVFVVIFAGTLTDARLLIGPDGLIPLPLMVGQFRQNNPTAVAAVLQAPSLFWISSHPGFVTALGWSGLLAAGLLVFNYRPRAALAICWLVHLSFVATWGLFSGSQVDQLMLEVALLCIPFAPAGRRPGLGLSAPPLPLAVFMIRWLLFRVMLENGLVKLFAGDARWLNFTAMDVLYETSPFPTHLGFLAHNLPHAFHAAEVALTLAAELLAPLLALLGGRRGRWWAFILWTLLQGGIHLTNNFGWLNTASLALGVLLLDDRVLVSLARRLRVSWPALPGSIPPVPAGRRSPWWLRLALTGHCLLGLALYALVCGAPLPAALREPLQRLASAIEPFRSVNAFTLYSTLRPAHLGVEFQGSNDGGATWRVWEYRYLPQMPGRISPYLAPRYDRFEATLQIEVTRPGPSELHRIVGTHLLARTPELLARFRSDPFPDRPPTLLRLVGYRLRFNPWETYRRTGEFWSKQSEEDHRPMLYLDATGQPREVASEIEQLQALAIHGNGLAQFHLAERLAAGHGVSSDLSAALAWYRSSALSGCFDAQFALGLRYAQGDGVPRDEIEAMAWFDLAALSGDADALANRRIAEARVGPAGAASAAIRSANLRAQIELNRAKAGARHPGR